MNEMNEKDKDQLRCAVINVTHYKTFEDFQKHENYDRDDFKDQQENGFIQDITLGTYNGANDTFQTRTMDDSHILEAILADLHETDSYAMLNDIEETESMTQADYIRAYTEFYNVFTLEGSLYADRD
ncbi:MAG TPA: hypothetical protein VGC17_08825 [Lactovum miscens]|uniref:hypothetical protein n=1 Tax=Lactovum miscens TaxID=190387 RepID=UPI002ED8F491